jgi:hypothetical protein
VVILLGELGTNFMGSKPHRKYYATVLIYDLPGTSRVNTRRPRGFRGGSSW